MDNKTMLLMFAVAIGALVFYVLFADNRTAIQRFNDKWDKAVV